MGQFSCKGWDCKNSDAKIEEEFRTSDFNMQYQGVKTRVLHSPRSLQIDPSRYLSHLPSVISLQSFFRTFIARSIYKKSLKKHKPNFYYFSYEEVTAFISRSCRLPSYREETKSKMYSNGGVYSGELRGGFRDGFGVMQWKDGAKYTGEWSFGRPWGQGTFLFPDGDTYSGLWQCYFARGSENDLSGLGLILWKEGVKDGFKWLWYKKAICVNSPRSVSMTPRNEEKMQQVQDRYLVMRSYYEKQVKEDREVREAKERRYPDGSVYKGDMQGIRREGVGKIVWADGDVYEGEWKGDVQHGWGKSTWKEGGCYLGFFANNLKEGIGKYSWEDGTEYFGEWKANKMNGVGKYNWNDGKLYLGDWVLGTMEGFGVLVWRDGRKYEGSWHEGKKHGEGVTFYANGKVSRDVWRYGKIIRPDV
jgi:hypothetical protein